MAIFGKKNVVEARSPLSVPGATPINPQPITKTKIYRILPLGSDGDYEVITVPAPGHPTVNRDYKADFFRGWMIEEEFNAIRERFADVGVEMYPKGVKPPDEKWMRDKMGDEYYEDQAMQIEDVNISEQRPRRKAGNRPSDKGDLEPRRKAGRTPGNRKRSPKTSS